MSSSRRERTLQSRSEKTAAFAQWRSLNHEIVLKKLKWSDIGQRLLGLISETDALWRDGKVAAGIYRQKGNLFRDTVISLVQARCGLRIEGRKVPGRSDKHAVDLAAFESSTGGPILVLAGETKMIGSPPHATKSEHYPERTISIDIDKRSKDKLHNVQEKFESLREYNNATAVAIYRELNGVYEWVPMHSTGLLDLDQLTELISGHLT